MRGICRTALGAVLLALAFAVLGPVAPASASLDQLLSSCPATPNKDGADNDLGNGVQLGVVRCDDGVPDFGGTTPNPGGAKAVEVPAAYDGAAGLPAQSAAALAVPGNAGGKVALDVNLTLPDPAKFGGPYPVVVLMHGCCSGSKTSWERDIIDPQPPDREGWHYNNVWFAARGYAVVTYTARGFVDGSGHGSTGETQLDSSQYEVNDLQSLVGQLADKADLNPAAAGAQTIDPSRVVVTGGSYGGGLSWMTLTDPVWHSPGGATVKLAAAAPKFGWTNLVESLVPGGVDPRDGLPPTDSSQYPLGYPKRSIVAALYASGKTGVPPGSSRTTFPAEIDQAFQCLNGPDPFESNPACATTLQTALPRFYAERSAYFQNGFFGGLAGGSIAPVPVFSAGALSDPLFPAPEHRRMVERLKRTVSGYPVQEYYGDYNHFVQDKSKEWGDLCGGDHHLCRYSDYPGGNLNADPPSLARDAGVTTRLNRFIDHYAKPPGNPSQGQPAFDVTASLQICPQNAGGAFPGDEPGQRFTAPTFDALTQGSLTITATGPTSTTFSAGANPHAKNADPVANTAKNNSQCAVESSPGGFATAGPGVATYDSVDLPREFVLLGRTRLSVTHTGAGDPRTLAARLYDLYPDGTQVLVDRGVRRMSQPNGVTVLDLHGNGWRFPQGHRVRVEVAQDDDPYVRASNLPGSLTIGAAKLELPVRGASANLRGFAPPSGPRADLRVPRLASDQGTSSRIRMRLLPATRADKRFIDHYELEVRRGGTKRFRRLSSRLRSSVYHLKTSTGQTYLLRARAVDRAGHAGPWNNERTITPVDDGPRMGLRAGWSRARSRLAYGRRLSRTSRRGRAFSFRFRGDRIYLVGRTSRSGGKALLVFNGRRRVISFYSRRTRNRRVVWKSLARSRGVNRLRVVVLGRGLVEIDGLGFRRP